MLLLAHLSQPPQPQGTPRDILVSHKLRHGLVVVGVGVGVHAQV